MVVETLGFLIIIGALIYIVLRRQGLLAPFGDRTGLKSAEVTADRIRFEMEKSADEIINRLAEHIDRLESLIAQAEEVSARLDGKLTRLRREIHAAQESGILPVMTAEQLKSAATAPPPVSAAVTAVRPQPAEPDQASAGTPEPIRPTPYSGYSGELHQETAGRPESLAGIAGEAAEDVAEATEFAKLLDRTIEATEAAALDISSLPAGNKVVEQEPPERNSELEAPVLSGEMAGQRSPRQNGEFEAPMFSRETGELEPLRQDGSEHKPKRIDYYARARELKEQQPAYPEAGIEAITPVEAAALKAAARVSAVAEPTPTEEARRLLTAGYATEDIAKKSILAGEPSSCFVRWADREVILSEEKCMLTL